MEQTVYADIAMMIDPDVPMDKQADAFRRLRDFVDRVGSILPDVSDWAAHPDAQWWAVDADGSACWLYVDEGCDKPEVHGNYWLADGDEDGAHIDLPIGFDWRESLTKRPEGV